MKKTLALIMTAVLAAGLLAGCAKPQTETAVPQESTVAVEVGAAPETEATTAAAIPETTTAVPETTAAVQEGPMLVPAPTATLLQATVKSHYEIAQAEDNRQIYVVTVPEAVAGEDYSALNASLARDFDIEYKFAQSRRQEFVDAFEAAPADDFNADRGSRTEGVITRADSSVFSMKTVNSWYNGGTYDAVIRGYNYRPSDGTLLCAADVFRDIEQLETELKKRLQEDYPDAGFFDLENDLKSYNASLLPTDKNASEPVFSFALTADAAVFWFSKYELAPGASGCQTVVLPYRDYAYLLNEEFMVASEDYFTPVEKDVKNLIHGHELIVSEKFKGEGDTIDGVKVTFDGKEAEVSAFGYKELGIYAAVKDGKVFLYVFRNCDDDERYITVIDLNGDIQTAGEFAGGFAKENEKAEASAPSTYANITCVKQLTDPSTFALSEGKNGPAAVYTVSENGMPVKK